MLSYFQEHEEVNKRALEQWNRRDRYFVFIGGGLLILLLNLRVTAEFASIALLSGISIFLIGLVIFWMVQRRNTTKPDKQNGG
jgi:Ca2+/Na+ antiporter